MTQLFHPSFQLWWRKGSTVFLALFFLFGFLCGLSFYSISGPSLFSMMRSAYFCPVSIVGLCCVTVLPILFSAFAVYISAPGLILIISFCKAFMTALCSIHINQCFDTAGWLVCMLFLFCDFMLMPFYYFFWHRHISGERPLYIPEMLALISLFFLIACIDYRIISPLLAELI